MEKLPFEIICEIYTHCYEIDRRNLKQVSRRFNDGYKAFVSMTKSKKLKIYDSCEFYLWPCNAYKKGQEKIIFHECLHAKRHDENGDPVLLGWAKY